MDPEQTLRVSSHMFDITNTITGTPDENGQQLSETPQPMPSTPSSVLKWALNLVSPKRSASLAVSPVKSQGEIASPMGEVITTTEPENAEGLADDVVVLSASQISPSTPPNNSSSEISTSNEKEHLTNDEHVSETVKLCAPLVQEPSIAAKTSPADREKRKLEDDPETAVERLHVRRLPTVEVSLPCHADHVQEAIKESSAQFRAPSISIEQDAEDNTLSPCKSNAPQLQVEQTVKELVGERESMHAPFDSVVCETPSQRADTSIREVSPETPMDSDQNMAITASLTLEETGATLGSVSDGISSVHLSPNRKSSDVTKTIPTYGTSDVKMTTNAYETSEINTKEHHDISEFDPLAIPIPKDWMIGFDSPKASVPYTDNIPPTTDTENLATAPSPHHPHQAFQTPKHKARPPHPYSHYSYQRQFNQNQGGVPGIYVMSPPPSLLDTIENEYASPGSTLKYTVHDFEQLKKELEDKRDSEMAELRAELERKTTLYEKEVLEKEQIQIILDDYEKTVAKLLDDTKREKERTTLHIERLTSERERLSEQVDAMEASFKELRIRYEELKEVQEVYRRNDETLRGTIEQLKQDVIIAEQRYEKLKRHAEEKLDSANTEIAKVRSDNDKEITGLKAKLLRTELQVRSLESGVEAKTKENQELLAICDTLMAKMEGGR